MASMPVKQVIDNLPVAEMQATIEEFTAPLSALLPDARLRRNVALAVAGILSRESPVITEMAQGIPRSAGSNWAIAKRFYRLLGNPRLSTQQFTKGLYLRARATVRAEAPAYVVIALDPVNFAKPYTRKLEGVSTVHKSTPPDRHGEARLTWGYPATTATVVNTRVPAVTYAHWFSYTSRDFLSEGRELERSIRMTRAVLPGQQRRFVMDSRGDDAKIFAWLAEDEFVIRATHLERSVEVYNERTGQWERETLGDLVDVTLWRAEFGTVFCHAGKTRSAILQVGWYPLRLPDTQQRLWALVYYEREIERTTVLLTHVPVYVAATAKLLYNDWSLRAHIEHGYRFDQEQGLDVEDMRVRFLSRMQRLFVLVLLAAQLVFHLAATWPPAAVTWLRRLGGKLDLGIDRDGPYILLAGLSAVWQALTTLSWATIAPFPHQLFPP